MLTKSNPLKIPHPTLNKLVAHTRKVLTQEDEQDQCQIPDLNSLSVRNHNLEVLMNSFSSALTEHVTLATYQNLNHSQNTSGISAHRKFDESEELDTLEHMTESNSKQMNFYAKELNEVSQILANEVKGEREAKITKQISEIKKKIKRMTNFVSILKRDLNYFWIEQDKNFAESKGSYTEAFFRLKYFEIKNEALSNQLKRLEVLGVNLRNQKDQSSKNLAKIKSEVNMKAFEVESNIPDIYESVKLQYSRAQKNVECVTKIYNKNLENIKRDKEILANESRKLKKDIEGRGTAPNISKKTTKKDAKKSILKSEVLVSKVQNATIQDSQISIQKNFDSTSKNRKSVIQSKPNFKVEDEQTANKPLKEIDPSSNIMQNKPHRESMSKQNHPDSLNKPIERRSVVQNSEVGNRKSFSNRESDPKMSEANDSKLPSIISAKKSIKENVSKPKKIAVDYDFA
jgi:hypothetical protein